jgi:DNA modification methylase
MVSPENWQTSEMKTPPRAPKLPNTLSTELRVVHRALSELKPYSRNARKHSKQQIRQIAHSIEVFGFWSPIQIDADGNIVNGHGRAKAAKLLGIENVPTIQVEGLTEEQLRLYRIADNRIAELSEWDDAILKIEFQELDDLELDIELSVTGFDLPAIDLMLSLDEDKPSIDPDDRIDVDEISVPVTQLGDAWQLDAHRVLCGNALEESSYAKLMGTDKAAVVVSDSPYNVKIAGNVSGKGAVKHDDFAMACGEMDEEQFSQFLSTSIKFLASYSLPGSMHYLAIDWRHIGQLLAAGDPLFGQPVNVCVWVKERGGQGSQYRSQHEMFVVYKNGTGPPRNNIQLGKYGRNRTNVWNYPSAASFSKNGDEGNLLQLHPTVKPVALVADAILDSSARGEIVLDNFLGSGTTLIAAERTGRICYGIELNPRYVDVAIRRWQRHTGGHAVNAFTRKRFDDVAGVIAEVTNG